MTYGPRCPGTTVACFVDLKNACDSVWSDRVLLKLAAIDICGRMLAWLSNFLSERKVACFVGIEKGSYNLTLTGLPQGRVFSPMLFNIFVRDMF